MRISPARRAAIERMSLTLLVVISAVMIIVGKAEVVLPPGGFLQATAAGEEVYLSRNAVVGGGFDRLKVGDRVRYVVDLEEGDNGPQASTVVPLDPAK